MRAFTRFLLLNIYLFSQGYANGESTSEAVKWLEPERSVLVHLPTPDLYFWDQRDQRASQYPGAFIFNFTLTPDNRTILLNDEPILPRAYPHLPTRLRAHQTGEPAAAFAVQVRTNYSGAPLMDLDYYIDAPDATSGTSIYNTRYNPRLRLDILRANIATYPGYRTALSSDSQNQIWVYLEDLSAHPPGTLYSNIPMRIQGVKVDRRWPNHRTPGTTTYRTPEALKKCHIWSWLCADVGDYPYYKYIYRENFDQHGKKGSMRHFWATRWSGLVGLIGVRQAIGLLAACGSMVLSMVVCAVIGGVKSVVEMYQKRVQEVDDWLADEEVDDLLPLDGYLQDLGELEKEKVDKGAVIRPVSRNLTPPPYTLMTMEKSSIS